MKTLYVPKGKTLHYERLECQTIIADGTLVVDGAVRAKRITGKGDSPLYTGIVSNCGLTGRKRSIRSFALW